MNPLELQCLRVFLYALADPPMSVMMAEIQKLEEMINELSPAELAIYTTAMEGDEEMEMKRVE